MNNVSSDVLRSIFYCSWVWGCRVSFLWRKVVYLLLQLGMWCWSRWCRKCLAHFSLSLPVLFFPLCFPPSVIPSPLLSLNLPHQPHLNLCSLPAFMLLTPFTLFPRTFRFVSIIFHSLFPSVFLSTLSPSWWVLRKASLTSCSQRWQPTPVLTLLTHSFTHSLLLFQACL